ncbi:MAG: hypothetical protein HWE27_00590 [Gammaproteobacteria bacterium]|nr:hypothetical protein [Gammaproteobacteria bacterium]
MEQPYQSPEAEIIHQAPQPSRRTAPTVWGIIFMILAVLGFLASIMGFLAIMTDSDNVFGLSRSTLVVDSSLSLSCKILLFLFSLALIIRARWVLIVGYIGLALSVTDSVFKGIVVIPAQASAAFSDAQAIGTYVGFYFLAAISLAMYLGLLLYLRGSELQKEFGLS